jgi:hypothetical protein
MNKTILENIGIIIGSFLLIGLIAVIMAWPVQLLWNGCLVPAVTFANPIGFWQALGLNVLVSLLFGSKVSNSNNSKSN